MIAIIDYDAGNICSVINVLKHFDVEFVLADCPEKLQHADGIILPGVGAFGPAMERLVSRGLDIAIKQKVNDGIPLLGICLGLQLLYETSQESVGAKGLGLIEGSVDLLDAPGEKIPHIGWTSICNLNSPILNGIDENEYFYFVHSFGAHAVDKSVCGASGVYGGHEFDAVVSKNNIYGCQFHPEKSSKFGKKIIENFLELTKKSVK